jgi:hypothetical protein
MAHKQLTDYISQKEIVKTEPELIVALPCTVAADAVLGNLDVGTVLGLVTGTGKVRRVTRAPVKTGGAFATSAATGSVIGASVIFKAGDVLVKASDASAIGTVQSVAGDVITLTGNSAQVVAQGTDILVTGGSGVAYGILREVTDARLQDQFAARIISGFLNKDQLIGLTAQGMVEMGMVDMGDNTIKF